MEMMTPHGPMQMRIPLGMRKEVAKPRMPFPVAGFMLDLASQLEKPQAVREMVFDLAQNGYNLCLLNIGDAFQYKRHPRIARPNAWTLQDMQELQKVCAMNGMEVVPVIPTLGDCAWITTKEGYADYDEGRGTGEIHGSLCPSFPEVYDLIKELFQDWSAHVPGRYIHAGMGLSPALGKYLERAAGRDKVDLTTLFGEHVNRVAAVARAVRRRMIIWGDMFHYLPDAIKVLPEDVIVIESNSFKFERFPRVAAFNYAEFDSVNLLKKTEAEVWVAPSVWPNGPFPDIEERWDNLNCWVRYGKEAHADGLVILDRDNNTGFLGNTWFCLRVLGAQLQKPFGTKLSDTIKETLEKMSGCRNLIDKFVRDVMSLGSFNLSGYQNKNLMDRPLDSMAHASQYDEPMLKAKRLEGMFLSIQALASSTKMEEGRDFLNGLYLSWTYVKLYWKLRAELPDCYAMLLKGPDETRLTSIKRAFRNVAAELETFAADYEAHWNKVRFAGDRMTVVEWARRSAPTLREWADELDQVPPTDHRLVRSPRLECTFRGRHPAEPWLEITIVWADGSEQKDREFLVRYEEIFARPDMEWTSAASIPLERDEWPMKICFDAPGYGEVGIDDVRIMWQGLPCSYRMGGMDGQNVQHDGKTLWLGPVSAYPGSPIARGEFDRVWFESGPVT